MKNLLRRESQGQMHVWVIAGLLALTFFAFFPVFQCGFVGIDDDIYLTENSVVMRPVSWWSIKMLWVHPVMDLWHPLTSLTLHIGYQFWGLNPIGYHAMNLLIHMASVAVLYAILVIAAGSPWRAAAVAALFAIHPLRVESVAWVIEIKDVGSVFFALVCMLAYVMNLRSPSPFYRWGSVAALVVSLLYKPMFVTMPALLLLLDYWPLARTPDNAHALDVRTPPQPVRWIDLTLEKMPFATVSLLSVAMTILMVKSGPRSGSEQMIQTQAVQFANIPISLMRYLGEIFYFENLTIHHQMPDFWPLWQVVGACALVLFLTVSSFILRQRFLMFFVGWWWFVVTLIPVIGIIKVSDYSIADRYTYFASIGVCVAIVYAIPARWFGTACAKWTTASGIALLLTLLSAATWRELSYWKSMETLFARGVQVEPDNGVQHWIYAVALAKAGRFDQSDKHLELALRFAPAHPQIQGAKLASLRKHKKHDEAIALGNQLIKTHPGYLDAYIQMADVYGEMGNLDAALVMLNKALELHPTAPLRWINRGLVLLRQNKTQEAALDFQQALEIEPENFQANAQLGFMYATFNSPENAVNHFKAAFAFKPDVEVGIALGQQLARLNRWKESADAFAAVRKLEPKNTTVLTNEALARAQAGDPSRAAGLLRQVIDLDPKSPVPRDMLGMLLAQTGDVPGALAQLTRAQEIAPGNLQREKLIADLQAKIVK